MKKKKSRGYLLIMAAEEGRRWLAISAPMVRYSKAPFRMLVQKYGVDLSFSPMILADSFVASPKARAIDLPILPDEDREKLVIQFATNQPHNFGQAVGMVREWCAGVDLNCGCPQRWAREEGIGSALLQSPELIAEIIRKGVEASNSKVKISAKIRIVNDSTQDTVELGRRLEMMGASWITLHGRTPKASSNLPVRFDVVRDVKKSLQIPLFSNGGVYSLEDANKMYELTGADGIMAAQGLLENPALFSGSPCTWQVVQDFVELGLSYPGTVSTPIFMHHLHLMTGKLLPAWEKKLFHSLSTISSAIDFIQERRYVSDVHNISVFD